jgi:hypothetical protein
MRTGSALRVVRLTVPLRRIERRLASDVTSGRRDDLREAAASNAAAEVLAWRTWSSATTVPSQSSRGT